MGPYQGPCFAFGGWWIFPLIMIVFCIFMMLVMRRRMPGGMCSPTGPPGPEIKSDSQPFAPTDSARDILDRRYALGEIGREEYEKKKADLSRP